MSRTLLVDALREQETRVAIIGERKQIEYFDFSSSAKRQLKSNIYLAKVTRVEPSLQAAFVEYGAEKQGFLSSQKFTQTITRSQSLTGNACLKR